MIVNSPAPDMLNERSQEIFRRIVDAWMTTGEPVGSRTLSNALGKKLSPASIRNVMADLEDAGMLMAPHTSAGRVPTETGLRMFVDGLLEVGDISEDERQSISREIRDPGGIEDALTQASHALSGLSSCASVVMVPKNEGNIRQIELVPLNDVQALVVLVNEDGSVENRILDLPAGSTRSSLQQASNFLTASLTGQSVGAARLRMEQDLDRKRTELDQLTEQVVDAGMAVLAGDPGRPQLIVKGRSKLLETVSGQEDLEQIRLLLDELDHKQQVMEMLNAVDLAEGVRVFIGSENQLFSMTGCSMIVAPWADENKQVVGALGVIGPMRLNYGRIIPMVDFTAKMVGKLLS